MLCYRNVLKNRKEEAVARAAERAEFERQAAMKPIARPPVQTTINPAALDTKVRVGRKAGVKRTRPSADAGDANGEQASVPVDKEVLRRAVWKVSSLISFIPSTAESSACIQLDSDSIRRWPSISALQTMFSNC